MKTSLTALTLNVCQCFAANVVIAVHVVTVFLRISQTISHAVNILTISMSVMPILGDVQNQMTGLGISQTAVLERTF